MTVRPPTATVRSEVVDGGRVVREHVLTRPLWHRPEDAVGDPDEPMAVFAREVTAVGGEDRPWLLWLQGGPGYPAHRPAACPWLAAATARFRVLLVDQRGTGASTPLGPADLAARGDAGVQAALLRQLGAPAIVDDAEAFRRALAGPDVPWYVLGESFGGFCALTYLSRAPEGLAGAMIAAGLPPLHGGPLPVYRATARRAAAANQAFFRRYPADRARAAEVAELLVRRRPRLPTGEVLTPRRFRGLGILLAKTARRDLLHDLLLRAVAGPPGARVVTDGFLAAAGAVLSHAGRPLYPLLHESCYCNGSADGAPGWAAQRVLDETPALGAEGADVAFTVEMTLPWHFEEDPALRPLAAAADVLAAWDRWPALYDPGVLQRNRVPVAAAVYPDDPAVDAGLSLQTAAAVGSLEVWTGDTHLHDGLDTDPAVFDALCRRVGR